MQPFDKLRPLPDVPDAVKAVPHRLGARANFFRRHFRMWPEKFGAQVRRYEPAPRDWNAANFREVRLQCLFPTVEVHRARKWRQHDELREREAGALCNL